MFKLFDEFGDWLRTTAGTYLEQAVVTAMNKVKHGFVVVDDASVLAQLNLPREDEVAVLPANTWEPLGDWDAHWTFEDTPPKQSFDLMIRELLKRMYFFQEWLITAVQRLHTAGVNLTCYRPRGSAEDLTGAYPAASQL